MRRWNHLQKKFRRKSALEHLVDEAEQVGARAMHALKRLLRLFRAEAPRVRNHHLCQSDDGIERRAPY
jgi:type II secretory pathway predicted ATPase ExeA